MSVFLVVNSPHSSCSTQPLLCKSSHSQFINDGYDDIPIKLYLQNGPWVGFGMQAGHSVPASNLDILPRDTDPRSQSTSGHSQNFSNSQVIEMACFRAFPSARNLPSSPSSLLQCHLLDKLTLTSYIKQCGTFSLFLSIAFITSLVYYVTLQLLLIVCLFLPKCLILECRLVLVCLSHCSLCLE